MRILVSGSTGLIGRALCPELLKAGHELNCLVRKVRKAGDYEWSVDRGALDLRALDGIEAVIHLAGEPVVGLRWTAEKRRKILESRVKGTALLFESVAKLPTKPKTFICASAIGIYGNRAGELLNENSARGPGFLADVVSAWEAQAARFQSLGIRVVNLRFGVVLSSVGGALKMMLPAFRLGIGGRLGTGEQYMSWVSLQDALQAILFALNDVAVSGPLNIVAPQPLTNREFTAALAHALHRPAFCHVPGFVLKLVLGQMADEMLLSSARVEPKRLIEAGFKFRDGEISRFLDAAIRAETSLSA